MHNSGMNELKPQSVLTIAGSDSGGGAGIQADLKTFAAHGVHGLSAIAALTAQNTRGVTAVHAPPTDFLRAQIDACFNDFNIGSVKLGMLANAQIIHTIVNALEHYRPRFVVLDPVMVATSGAKLLEDTALDALRTRLLPLASIITPNIPEAEMLLGHAINNLNSMRSATNELLALGATAVLLKGGHLPGNDEITDVFANADGIDEITHPRLQLQAHGTGCTLASAVTANLALGNSPRQACMAAAGYVHRALQLGYRPGHNDILVLNHFAASPIR
jgi:hydroxymethylpyrimidine/phosphomethylpyrimidine kinase